MIRLEDCTPAQRRLLLAMVALRQSIEDKKKAVDPVQASTASATRNPRHARAA